MVAYQFRMPAGIAGEVTRSNSAVVEPQLLSGTNPPTAFGVFTKMVAGLVQQLASGDAASVISGILVRPYPTGLSSSGSALGAGVPSAALPASVLRSGYANMKLARGSAVRGAQVYVRITAGSYAVGDIEDATNLAGGQIVAVANCFFMGSADASGNVEVSFNI
jgi:hypothetical protein